MTDYETILNILKKMWGGIIYPDYGFPTEELKNGGKAITLLGKSNSVKLIFNKNDEFLGVL